MQSQFQHRKCRIVPASGTVQFQKYHPCHRLNNQKDLVLIKEGRDEGLVSLPSPSLSSLVSIYVAYFVCHFSIRKGSLIMRVRTIPQLPSPQLLGPIHLPQPPSNPSFPPIPPCYTPPPPNGTCSKVPIRYQGCHSGLVFSFRVEASARLGIWMGFIFETRNHAIGIPNGRSAFL